MAISYVRKQKVNPKDRFAAKKWYATAKSQQEVSFDRMCMHISNASSATKGDVQLALNGLIFQLVDALSDGHIVRMGDFGSFRMTLSGTGAEKVEDFTGKLISKCRVVFSPGPLLRDFVRTASYRCIDELPKTPVDPETPVE